MEVQVSKQELGGEKVDQSTGSGVENRKYSEDRK